MKKPEKKKESWREKIRKWEDQGKYERREADQKAFDQWEAHTIDYWKKKLRQYPQATKADLETCIEGMKRQIQEMDAEWKRMEADRYENHDRTVELKQFMNSNISVKKALESLKNGKVSSNRAKLHVASGWMDPLMKKITENDLPKHDDILSLFEKEYPCFKNEFNLFSLQTPEFARSAVFVKRSIALAVIFIYEKRHDKPIKDYTTVTKKYDELGYW